MGPLGVTPGIESSNRHPAGRPAREGGLLRWDLRRLEPPLRGLCQATHTHRHRLQRQRNKGYGDMGNRDIGTQGCRDMGTIGTRTWDLGTWGYRIWEHWDIGDMGHRGLGDLGTWELLTLSSVTITLTRDFLLTHGPFPATLVVFHFGSLCQPQTLPAFPWTQG